MKPACWIAPMLWLLAVPLLALPQGDPPRQDIRPGEGVARASLLSEFHPPLRGTRADTPVYIMDGGEPGGTLFVLGGNHMSEPAGMMAAIVMVERAVVERGRVIVIPMGNLLAADTRRMFTLEGASGPREFFWGERRAHPHLHPRDRRNYFSPSGRTLPGEEARNLNRVWPGRADGTPMEQIAHAIVQMMREQRVDVAFDLHETGSHDSDLAWTLAAMPEHRAFVNEVISAINASVGGRVMYPRVTDQPRSMSRTEWDRETGAMALLTETVNEGDVTMEYRVAIQLENIIQTVNVFNRHHPERAIVFRRIPDYHEMRTHGFANALNE